ncbi:hypothetical protein EGW08_020284 [Elysia chlorotica]|uniref:TIR domain-containing protein n=1 Tax=Elysia chlorotica TaxID=188477 RepID=A0A3S0ZCQ7_ELYCH|nr:hypothetical protein EGW08_020284 [Elysia chlorotica]
MENQKVGCECEDKFSDNMCDKPCLLECGESGKCRIQDDNGTEECFCSDHRYRGFNCSILIEELQPSGLGLEAKAAVGVVAVLMVCLMMLLVVLYALWRRRNITMMKIVYWFHSFEEDDDRDCDAFVSYASADLDRQFVIQVLAPMLEGQMCFSLCLHQRDFLPGQYISHNISESVKRSRRTIMVVSPAYVSSDWCRFEFQMALQEMVSQKHRILPILLDDVGSLKKDMDETLKKVLEAVTWIKYPGTEAKDKELDQFWKRISLSMPKKRPVSEEQGPIKAHPAHIVSPSLSPNTNLTSSTCKGFKDIDSSDIPEGSTHHYEIILHEGDKEDAIFRVSPPGKDSDGGFESSRKKRARTTLLPNFLGPLCGRSNSKSFSSSQSHTQTSESVLNKTGIPKNRRFV